MATQALEAQKPPEALAPTQKQEKLIVVSQGRPAYPTRALNAFGVSQGDWVALVDAVFPAAKTTEGIELALSYCRARKLDVFKRPVHVVPIWNSKLGREVESVWSGIGELRTTASRTGLWAGCDAAVFGPEETRTFRGVTGKGQYEKEVEKTITFPSWCSIIVYKMVGGQRVPFPGPRVLWRETYATMGKSDVPNDMWETRPFGQLEKCAEAAALRRAFPEEIGEYIVEEAGRRGPAIEVQPVEGGTKTERLAARLTAKPEAGTVIDVAPQREREGMPLDLSGAGGDEGEAPSALPSEPLQEAQLEEILALIDTLGVSLDEVEGEFGGRLDRAEIAGLDALGLRAAVEGFVRQLATKRQKNAEYSAGAGGSGADPDRPSLFQGEVAKRRK